MRQPFVRSLALAGGVALLVACAGEGTRPDAPAAAPAQIVSAAQRAGAADLWPGFDPRTTPLAIYDGTRTWLFRHPAPPAGFVAAEGGAWVFEGRHPTVVSNSSVMLGGVSTATLMPGPGSAMDRAGTAIHETFHVFQRARHPKWVANEVDLFLYPAEDAEILYSRRLESAALSHALASRDSEAAACSARLALARRDQRFANMPAGSVDYERKTELNEGLANYVELRATRRPDAAVLKATPQADGFAPDKFRHRAYASGAALGRLLDRFAPDWRAALESNDAQSLDQMLAAALPGNSSLQCDFTMQVRLDAANQAVADVAALVAQRAAQRQAFDAAPGWRIVIESKAPLWPQNFDPWNVTLLDPRTVLHTRTLKLSNTAGSFEVLGYPTLTEAAGVHPLFNGVKRSTIGGLTAEPKVANAGGVLTITAPEVTVSFKGAKLSREGKAYIVRL